MRLHGLYSMPHHHQMKYIEVVRNLIRVLSLQFAGDFIVILCLCIQTLQCSAHTHTGAFSPADICNKHKVLEGPWGVISSPSYPHVYPNYTSCTWYINSSPGRTITISFDDFDVEEDIDACIQPTCCNHNWLSISSLPQGMSMRYCGRNRFLPPFATTEGQVVIKFHTTKVLKNARGFQLTYFIGNGKVSACGEEQFLCANRRCILKQWICNDHNECGDNSDEKDCQVHNCKGKIACRNRMGQCYLPGQRCNGLKECVDGSDEEGCTEEMCSAEKGGFLCRNTRCILDMLRCDNIDDCGDESDEKGCLKNSVITAAVMGSLICGLLLVVAIGCTCKLYSLRLRDLHAHQLESRLCHMEEEFLQREPPPSYAMAMNDPSARYFMDHMHLRFERRIRRARRSYRRSLPPAAIGAVSGEITNSENNSSQICDQQTGLAQPASQPVTVTPSDTDSETNAVLGRLHFLQNINKDKSAENSNEHGSQIVQNHDTQLVPSGNQPMTASPTNAMFHGSVQNESESGSLYVIEMAQAADTELVSCSPVHVGSASIGSQGHSSPIGTSSSHNSCTSLSSLSTDDTQLLLSS